MITTILMVAMLGQVSEKPSERQIAKSLLTGQAVFDRQMNRTYVKMRAEMTPAEKAHWKKHYAKRREELEPLRQNYKKVASGEIVIKPEARDKLRGMIRDFIASMEKESKFYMTPNEYRRYLKTVTADANAALKALEN